MLHDILYAVRTSSPSRLAGQVSMIRAYPDLESLAAYAEDECKQGGVLGLSPSDSQHESVPASLEAALGRSKDAQSQVCRQIDIRNNGPHTQRI